MWQIIMNIENDTNRSLNKTVIGKKTPSLGPVLYFTDRKLKSTTNGNF